MAGPFLSHITNTFFVSLINRLGVRPPPPDGFDLINTVQPVSIVDSDISLNAVASTILLDTPFTTGVNVAPGIGTVLADTGAQLLGNYQVFCLMSVSDHAVFPSLGLERRDAANAANIWAQEFYITAVAAGVSSVISYQLSFRAQLQLNERIRVRNIVAGGALSRYQVSIWLQPVA